MSSQPPQSPSLAYYLGQFVGHVVQGVKADVTKPQAQSPGPSPMQPDRAQGATTSSGEGTGVVVRTQVGEATVLTQHGPVTLRRTVIDEVQQ